MVYSVLNKKSFKSFSQMPIESITTEERKAVKVPPPKLNPYPKRCLSPSSPRQRPVRRKAAESPPSQVVPQPSDPPQRQGPKKPRAYQPFKQPKMYGRTVAQSTRTKRLGTWAPYGKTEDWAELPKCDWQERFLQMNFIRNCKCV